MNLFHINLSKQVPIMVHHGPGTNPSEKPNNDADTSGLITGRVN